MHIDTPYSCNSNPNKNNNVFKCITLKHLRMHAYRYSVLMQNQNKLNNLKITIYFMTMYLSITMIPLRSKTDDIFDGDGDGDGDGDCNADGDEIVGSIWISCEW